MDIDYSHFIVAFGAGWIAGNIYNGIKSYLIGWYWTRQLKKYPNYAGEYDSDIYYDSETPIGDRLAKEMGL
jgi:hypothetical protein